MTEHFFQEKYFLKLKKEFKVSALEVSVLNRCIDIVYVNSNKEIVTIEVKLSNWKRAVEQAKDHQLYADKSYICLLKPKRGFSKQFMDTLRLNGIGLICFNHPGSKKASVRFKKKIQANKNTDLWKPARKKLESMLYV